MSTPSDFYAPNLTQRPPRSPRVRLGGYAVLPRILDKCRATIAGVNGEFHYNSAHDQHFMNFTGTDPEALKAEVATGKGDGELLEWVNAHAKHKRMPWEIAQWSQYIETRTPDSDEETITFFAAAVGKFSKTREDIRGWADLLDLDDHVTFGGKA
jgi:hypothetical protein